MTVRKLRVSAFAGSDLELVLRSGGIDSLQYWWHRHPAAARW